MTQLAVTSTPTPTLDPITMPPFDIAAAEAAAAAFCAGLGNPDDPVALVVRPRGRDAVQRFCIRGTTAAKVAAQLASDPVADIWVSVNPLGAEAKKRRAVDVAAVAHLVLDVDLKPGACADDSTACGVVADVAAEVGAVPVRLVRSGHGWQAWWAVSDGRIGSSDSSALVDEVAAKSFSKRFWQLANAVAARRGVVLDDVSDLSRVMRVPGTWNVKSEPAVQVHGWCAEQDPAGQWSIAGIAAGDCASLTVAEVGAAADSAGVPDEAARLRRAVAERSARSTELTNAINEVDWDVWLAGDTRLWQTGRLDGCGCPIWHWHSGSDEKSATLHEGCAEVGEGAHVWSDSMKRDLGLDRAHMSRLDLAVALRGQSRQEVAASVGIELRRRLTVVDADYMDERADDLDARIAAGDLTWIAAGPGGTHAAVEVTAEELRGLAAEYRAAAAAMRAAEAARESSPGRLMPGQPVIGDFVAGAINPTPGVLPVMSPDGKPVELAPVPAGVAALRADPAPEPPTFAHVADTDQLALNRITGTMPAPSAPLAVARRLVEMLWTDRATGLMTLRRWRGDWIAYTGARWRVISKEQLRQAIYVALETATVAAPLDDPMGADADPKPWNPTESAVDKVIDALVAVVLMPDSAEPTHIGHVAVADGILNLATRQLLSHSPAHFSFTCLPYPYLGDAAEPVALLAFLHTIWPDDAESVALIQEWLGYMVSGETGRQKGLLILGPPRSGKGTILWLIKMLVGAANASAPTLASLCSNFGMQPLIGKSVALVGDARLSGSTSTTTLVERLLSLIGEDEMQIDRKYRDPWTGRLAARITIASNELPRFADSSAAVVTRFEIAEMSESFLGREDHGLKDRLAAELPAILVWALDGLDRLNRNGRFTRPAAAAETAQAMEDLASPVKAFLRECTEPAEGAAVPKEDLYGRWVQWCGDHGHHAGSTSWFGRNLKGCGIKNGKESTGERRPTFVGIGLLPAPAVPGQPPVLPGLTPLRGPQPVVVPIRPAG